MFRQKEIKQILDYISLAADSLDWNDERKVEELKIEVERQIRSSLKADPQMRASVEAAYNAATILCNTGHSLLFYKRHDRQPIELKLYFSTDSEDIRHWVKRNKIKYVTEKELKIIYERVKTDSSKTLCDPHCKGFWRSERNAARYHMPVSFEGENLDYCDKSECIDQVK